MSKRLKKYIKIAILVFLIGIPLLSVRFNNGVIDYSVDSFVVYYYNCFSEIIEHSFIYELYYLVFADLFGDCFITQIVFVIFTNFILIDLLGILYDVLMFIPNVVGKLLNNMSKGGVKDE